MWSSETFCPGLYESHNTQLEFGTDEDNKVSREKAFKLRIRTLRSL
jgi:hypothetical protein